MRKKKLASRVREALAGGIFAVSDEMMIARRIDAGSAVEGRWLLPVVSLQQQAGIGPAKTE